MKKLTLVSYAVGVFVFNLASILLGIVYLLFPNNSLIYAIIFDIAGWIFLVSWAGALILPLLITRIADPHTASGKRLNRYSYIMLFVSILAVFIMFGMSFLVSMATSNDFSEIGLFLILLCGSFFGYSSMNCVFAITVFRQEKSRKDSKSSNIIQNTEPIKNPEKSKRISILRYLLILYFSFGLLGMIYFAFLSLAGKYVGVMALPSIGGINGVMGVMASAFGWLFSILSWGLSVGGAKILKSLRKPKFAIAYGIIGLITGSILLAPMIATPLMVSDVDYRFGEAFGSDWQSRIPTSASAYFKATRVTAAQYFLPTPVGDCTLIKDISFYNGTSGIDDGVTLFFDAYLPPVGQDLPGANSTLIRIHGGGWMIGDKGIGNMPIMNQYFASQGYCVFDIQYGLSNQSSFLDFASAITPQYLVRNFTIDDMMRHIGIFCQFIAVHKDEYNANLSSTFISGGSAGGHLTCATALGIWNGSYSSIFGTGITIKGYIPFYPANEVSQFIDGGVSDPNFYNPALMVNSTAPPCLVYQGDQDGLVHPQIAQNLKDKYTAEGNSECMIIYLPFSGHGSDLNFFGYYNQFFLYYMERFMYLYR